MMTKVLGRRKTGWIVVASLCLLAAGWATVSALRDSVSPLQQGRHESFFDYALRVKQLELSSDEEQACRRFVEDPQQPRSAYLRALERIFTKQLIIKMGRGAKEAPQSLLDRKVQGLMTTYLKDRLNLRPPITPATDLAKRARWDPHYHANSLFADHFPEARHFLPNFHEAYLYLGPRGKMQDRGAVVKRCMEDPTFAEITEGSSSYDRWHYDHAGKKLVPILCHKREVGAVKRQDVTGYDLCGSEPEGSYQSQRPFFESVGEDQIVRIHMGETVLPAHGRDHMKRMLDEAELYYHSSKPLRIGHGTHVAIDDMLRIAEQGHYVEACLSSNKRTGVIDHRSDYPLGVMLLLGVKVVIGTDGGRLYSTTLAEEYAYAADNIAKFRAKLQSSNDPIILPNGDQLCYRHIRDLMRPEAVPSVETRLQQPITYRELPELVKPEILERISSETLVENALTLLELCYGAPQS